MAQAALRKVVKTRSDGRQYDSLEVVPLDFETVPLRSLRYGTRAEYERVRRLWRTYPAFASQPSGKQASPIGMVTSHGTLALRNGAASPVVPGKPGPAPFTRSLLGLPHDHDCPPPPPDLSAFAKGVIDTCYTVGQPREGYPTYCPSATCRDLATGLLVALLAGGTKPERDYVLDRIKRTVGRVCWREMARARSTSAEARRLRKAQATAERAEPRRRSIAALVTDKKGRHLLPPVDETSSPAEREEIRSLRQDLLANYSLLSRERHLAERLAPRGSDYLRDVDLHDLIANAVGDTLCAFWAAGPASGETFASLIARHASRGVSHYLRRRRGDLSLDALTEEYASREGTGGDLYTLPQEASTVIRREAHIEDLREEDTDMEETITETFGTGAICSGGTSHLADLLSVLAEVCRGRNVSSKRFASLARTLLYYYRGDKGETGEPSRIRVQRHRDKALLLSLAKSSPALREAFAS